MSGLEIDERNGIWYAVGTVAGERIRKSLRTRDKARAEELKARLEARTWDRHHLGEEAVRTFEEAALKYLKSGGKEGTGGDGKFLPAILRHFKGRRIGSITPGEIREMALTLYPNGSAATRNRQAIVPARAVINHANQLGWCPPCKVKQFEVPKPRKHKPVDRDWLEAFMAEADKSGLPHLSALVLFMHQTAARVSEAIRLQGEHVDLGERIAMLEKTKTDEWSPRELTAELCGRLSLLGLRNGQRVFGYTDPKAVNRVMKRVAERAGIEQRTTHSAGRHSFGTNAIEGGARIKDAMDAGGWKSAKLFMETYVHSREAGRSVAAIFDKQQGPVVNIQTQPIKARKATFGKRK